MKGIVISTVGWLILAIVALILIFFFLTKSFPIISELIESGIAKFVETIKEKLT